MIKDFSPDVKKFILTYNLIEQLINLSKEECNKIYDLIEVEIAKQSWFSTTEFRTNTGWQWIQVWKKHWDPNLTQNCPFIHFEYGWSWSDKWAQISLDIESLRIVSRESIQSVTDHLNESLQNNKLEFLKKNKGWLLKPTLEEGRMLILNRRRIDRDEDFSAEWLLNTGIDLFNQLSEITPYIDDMVAKLFK
jgi:hypothetical protein